MTAPPSRLTASTVGWLLHLADPQGRSTPAAPKADTSRLLALARDHGVLPTLIARLPADERPAAAAAQRALLEGMAAQTLVLRQAAQVLRRQLAAAGIAALVVKGPSFADRLYKAPCWRPFTDIDLLLRRQDLPRASEVMQAAGYRPEGIALKHDAAAYGEEKWIANLGGMEVLVELHWDMIGSPTLRQGRRVDLALLQAEDGADTPAALLLVAAVHAAYGHAFDRLQPLVDVLQAARGAAGAVDSGWLARRAAEGGLGPGLALALDLAGRAFREPACDALRRAIGLKRPPLAIRRLMTPRVVVGAESSAHRTMAWRRQAVREWLKRAR